MHAPPAPVAYFAFNRPEHAALTLRALAANPEASATILHAFVDGPRHPGEEELVRRVRDVVSAATGFAAVNVHAAPANMGLFASITRGVQAVLDTNDTIIVVEDDIEVAPSFLTYMNDALTRYRDTPEVGSIHAYAPPIQGLPNYYFLRGADCWGWATWRDRWALFNPDAAAVFSDMANSSFTEFAHSHGWQSVIQLVRRAQNRNQSWAILWHASLFLARRYTLHPGQSFVKNIGHDGSGEHSGISNAFASTVRDSYLPPSLSSIEQDQIAARAISTFLDNLSIGWLSGRVGRALLSVYAHILVQLQARR